MEGLIPVVYKSLKKKKTRRKYECLSSGATQPYNNEDFHRKYGDDMDHHDYNIMGRKQCLMRPEANGAPAVRGVHLRRCNSAQVDHITLASEDDDYKPKQLMRFRSQRVLSCFNW